MYRPYLPDPKAEAATSPHSASGKQAYLKRRNGFLFYFLIIFVVFFFNFLSFFFFGGGGVHISQISNS